MEKKSKRETNGPGSTVERLDAYVSTGTKTGLAIWGNRLTWQTLFGYVPHFVEQLNTHRGVLEFLGGTFRDKKNSKLINPPQAFFSHQMEQMRASQVKLSQDVNSLTVRLQEEQARREVAERRVQELESQADGLKRMLLGSKGTGMMSSRQQSHGYGMGSNPNRMGFPSQGADLVSTVDTLTTTTTDNADGLLNPSQMQDLASKTQEIRDIAITLFGKVCHCVHDDLSLFTSARAPSPATGTAAHTARPCCRDSPTRHPLVPTC